MINSQKTDNHKILERTAQERYFQSLFIKRLLKRGMNC